ncbi:MAG: winged helix-turn-helix domain-containing protein [Herpetosiphonaceae bacterium]|nr:winged helix-turn-helix domain-containing protein [Herpetosiphonaceae bacterium]
MGNFRLLKCGQPVVVPSNGKVEVLLASLALRHGSPLPRDTLLSLLWPNHDPVLAGQSLNSLVYTLRKQFADVLGGATPILQGEGYYRLNTEAGVGVDMVQFEALVEEGNRQLRHDDLPAAISTYCRAVDVYQGDLWSSIDVFEVMERERLRACYLNVLAQLADYHFAQQMYSVCLDFAQRLLTSDPCREDAHRLVMRCNVRLGERAQALRQYQLCTRILRDEFDAAPERATVTLYEQVRLHPDSV